MSNKPTVHRPQLLSGWGRFPVQPCYVSRPSTLAALRSVIITNGPQSSYIARGLGRSYGDAALNDGGGVLQQTRQDYFVSFDEETGILECEAGATLAQIVETFLPRGWFLPMTPGTKYVTVGGAIAADVHGKNSHRDGAFGNFVLDLQLCTASGDVVHCSSDQHSDVFRTTIGGMGLTGVIVSARIRLLPVQTGYCRVTYQRTRDWEQTLERLSDTDDQHRYSVAWVDGIARGKATGRSVVMLGDHATRDELPRSLARRQWAAADGRQWSIPFSFPSWTLNGGTMKALNACYYARNGDGQRWVDCDSFFYPLDGVRNWNRVLGRRGFVQYQALFPKDTAPEGIGQLMSQVVQSKQLVTLAVLKSTGESKAGLLSYLIPGFTIALDFPNTGEPLKRLLRQLDQVLLRFGGRLYLAKDALTDPETFAAMYPNLDEFRMRKRQIDPDARFVSSQARRLGLVES